MYRCHRTLPCHQWSDPLNMESLSSFNMHTKTSHLMQCAEKASTSVLPSTALEPGRSLNSLSLQPPCHQNQQICRPPPPLPPPTRNNDLDGIQCCPYYRCYVARTPTQPAASTLQPSRKHFSRTQVLEIRWEDSPVGAVPPAHPAVGGWRPPVPAASSKSFRLV